MSTRRILYVDVLWSLHLIWAKEYMEAGCSSFHNQRLFCWGLNVHYLYGAQERIVEKYVADFLRCQKSTTFMTATKGSIKDDNGLDNILI